jgi:KDO2-lipid IV(A) lauroyltransferase
MKRFAYYISLPLIYGISLLPFSVLYVLSDGFYVLIYYIIGYRKYVVRQNLAKSFPDKTAEQLLKIEKQFYHYIVDFFLETLKCITISQAEVKKRVTMENHEFLEDLFKKNKNIIITSGHYGNHEWANLALSFLVSYKIKGVYRPLSNPYFEALFLNFRTKFGSNMVRMAQAPKEIAKKENYNFAFVLMNDQSPPPQSSYWTTFLNQETGFFTGIERFARKYDMPVVYMCTHKTARGKYHIKAELITDKPKELPEGQLLEMHAKKLERDIINDPSVWFWSHKRWKYAKVDDKIVELNYKK